MDKYSYEDIIMDPEDPRLEGAIGKECYFANCKENLLFNARNNSLGSISCLKYIHKEGPVPFIDENGYGRFLLIIKKDDNND